MINEKNNIHFRDLSKIEDISKAVQDISIDA
jgi:hypothetical protein